MNLLNLNIPGITKDRDDYYYFQGESVDSIWISADRFGYRSLHIEFRTSLPEVCLNIIEKFGFDEFRPYGEFMTATISQKKPNGLGTLSMGQNEFVLKLTVIGPAMDALIKEGKLISVNCDGVKTFELID